MELSIDKLLNFSSGGASIDVDAQAFFTAAGITDPTQVSAVNTLTLALKGANPLGINFWDKPGTKAVYPIVGGTANSHKYNLKDPRDLDAAFRIVWSGSGTHNSNGWTGNAADAFGDTKLNPLTIYGTNYCSFHTYVRISTTGICFGATSSNFDWSANSAFSNGAGSSVAVPQKFKGMSSVTRIDASNIGGTQNGDDLGSLAKAFVANGSSNFFIGKFSGGLFSDANINFNMVTDALTAAECAILNDIVYEFEVTLGRAAQTRECAMAGDSITFGTGASDNAHRYTSLFCANKNLTEVNYGFGGTPLESAVTVITNNLFDNRSARIPVKRAQRKYITIAHHANDVGYNTGNYTPALFSSQLSTIIDLAISRGWSPSSIYIISGFNINVATIYSTTTYGGITVSPSDQARFDSFKTAGQSTALAKGCGFIDLTGTYSFITDSADGLHPNDAGHAKISTYMATIIP